MFVAIALVTDERQFGLYSATYAGASLVSFFASVGQQSTVLRFWPQYASAGDIGGIESGAIRLLSGRRLCASEQSAHQQNCPRSYAPECLVHVRSNARAAKGVSKK